MAACLANEWQSLCLPRKSHPSWSQCSRAAGSSGGHWGWLLPGPAAACHRTSPSTRWCRSGLASRWAETRSTHCTLSLEKALSEAGALPNVLSWGEEKVSETFEIKMFPSQLRKSPDGWAKFRKGKELSKQAILWEADKRSSSRRIGEPCLSAY